MNIRIAFLLIVASSASLGAQNADINILRSFNSPEDLPSDNYFRFISQSESFLIFIVPAGLSVAGYISHDKAMIRKAFTGAAALAASGGITIILKYSVNRERPFITYPDIRKKTSAGSPSFPSGHTSSAFSTATSLSLSYPKWYIIAPSYTWAVTVGYSRMHLGVHYPSDVLAGAIIGSGCAYLTWIINRKLLARKP